MRPLLLPFRPAPLMLVAVFTILYLLAFQARIIGIPLALIITSWFFKYCFVLFDAAVAGHEPPVLSVEMVNPFNEQRPAMQLLLLLGLVLLLQWARSALGPAPALAIAVPALAILPANVGLLGVTGNAFLALSPAGLWGLIRALEWAYAWILLGTCLGIAALFALAPKLPTTVNLLLDLFGFLTFFAALGGSIHEHRVALGFSTLTRAEREAERDARAHQAARDRMLEHAYGLVRLHRRAEAWREIEHWVSTHAAGDDAWKEWSALLSAGARWDDADIADRLASLCLARLLAAGKPGLAFEVAEQRLAQHSQFVPVPPELRTRLAELAGLAGKRALQRRLAARDEPGRPA